MEACKAQVVFLAESCNEATYKKLIQARVEVKYVELRNNRCHVFAEHTGDMFHDVNGSYGPKRVGLTRMRLMSQKALRLHLGVSCGSPNLVSWEITC